jgi:hypothetical protein
MDLVGLTATCSALTTTGGTLSTVEGAVTPAATCGFTLAKTAAEVGRYTLTFVDKRLRLRGLACQVIGPDDAAFTGGIIAAVRDLDMTVGADDGTVELQLLDAGGADAEAMDGSTLLIVATTAK